MRIRDFLFFSIIAIIVIMAINISFEYDKLEENLKNYSSSNGCVDAPNVVSIDFQQSSVTMPSHETYLIQATLKDSSGSIVGIDPDWSTNYGTISPIIGLQQAIFTPGELESTTIWACAGNINESINVNVIQGKVISLTLNSDEINFTADENTKLDLFGEDIRGNKFELFPTKENWTYPDGSHLSVTNEIIWTPKIVGWHNISVQESGISTTLSFNITHGMAVKLSIIGDALLITSDESINLESVLVDKHNNYWPVSSNWSTYNSEASEWLNDLGEKAIFEGELIGSWKIFADYSDPITGQYFLAEYDILVSVGKLSQILLDGHGLTLTVDEVLDLNPRAVDSAGNLIGNIEMIWTINGKISTGSLEESGYLFSTEEIGSYEIQVVSEGGGASITCDFVNGEAVRIIVSETSSNQLTVRSGETIELFAEGEDQFGNRFATNLEWNLTNETGKMEPSSRGKGYYDFKPGDASGFVMMSFSALGIEDQIVIEVNPGEITKLRIEYDGEIKQGSTVRVLISAVDNSGNIVSFCDGNSLIITTDSGSVIREGNQIYLKFKTSGSNTIDVGCYGLKETFYLQIDDAIFGGIFEDSQNTMIITSIITIMIIVLLVVVIIRNREYEEFDDFYLVQNENNYTNNNLGNFPLPSLPQVPVQQVPLPQVPVQQVPLPQTSIPKADNLQHSREKLVNHTNDEKIESNHIEKSEVPKSTLNDEINWD